MPSIVAELPRWITDGMMVCPGDPPMRLEPALTVERLWARRLRLLPSARF